MTRPASPFAPPDCDRCAEILAADLQEFVYLWAPGKSEEFWRSIGEMNRGIAFARHQYEEHDR